MPEGRLVVGWLGIKKALQTRYAGLRLESDSALAGSCAWVFVAAWLGAGWVFLDDWLEAS